MSGVTSIVWSQAATKDGSFKHLEELRALSADKSVVQDGLVVAHGRIPREAVPYVSGSSKAGNNRGDIFEMNPPEDNIGDPEPLSPFDERVDHLLCGTHEHMR